MPDEPWLDPSLFPWIERLEAAAPVIQRELDAGRIRVEPCSADQLGPASIDLTLGDSIRVIEPVGAPIPIESSSGSRGYLEHQGEQVWSKLDGETLSQIATETGGAYIPAGTKQVDMADVYHGYIADIEQTEFQTAKINRYEARFQWFLVPALLLLLLEVALATSSPE